MAFEEAADAAVAGIRLGSVAAVEDAIALLEADPWCFRSGYAKGRLMRQVRRIELTGSQRARLVGVVLHAVDAGARLEFPETIALAQRLGGAELRRGLRERLHGDDSRRSGRALRVLVGLPRPRLTGSDRATARRIICDVLQDDRGHGVGWTTGLVRRLPHEEWAEELLERVRRDGEAAVGALRVLAKLSFVPSVDDAEMLRTLVLGAVEAGGIGEWWLEGIAARAGDEALVAALETLARSGDRDVSVRARWALSKIERTRDHR